MSTKLGNFLQRVGLRRAAPLKLNRYVAGERLVFMHVPKTAGTALTAALSTSLMPHRFVSGFDRVFFGDFDAFDTIDPKLRRSIYLEWESLPKNGDFVSGHISLSTLRKAYPVAQYFTVFREPVSRLLSFWLYWRSQTENQLRVWGDWAECVKRNRGPLNEFLTSPEIASPTDNVYVRMLLWPHPLIPDNDFIDARHDKILVRLALEKLKGFAFCDVVENPSLQTNIEEWLQRPFSLDFINETTSGSATGGKSLDEELTPEVYRLLEERTRLDLQVWSATAEHVGIVDPVSLRDPTLRRNIERHQRAMTTQAEF